MYTKEKRRGSSNITYKGDIGQGDKGKGGGEHLECLGLFV